MKEKHFVWSSFRKTEKQEELNRKVFCSMLGLAEDTTKYYRVLCGLFMRLRTGNSGETH